MPDSFRPSGCSVRCSCRVYGDVATRAGNRCPGPTGRYTSAARRTPSRIGMRTLVSPVMEYVGVEPSRCAGGASYGYCGRVGGSMLRRAARE